ncbi:MAG TPA: AAA family ATPase [Mycobacteriales bacterium]|nr:AAA family ATPase [Mycobacteriales bacterium]
MATDVAGYLEGPVTIMFTDIVGSTTLRTTLGDREADELFRLHDQLVLEQITENRGEDQKAALGDGFLAVFASTRRALAAAVGVQRALDDFNRARPGPPLTVRVGLNTGEVSWQDGHLSGEAVHAASRVCAAAKGGQILASDVTRQLAGTVPDVSFLDTGEHDLKGFPQPWRLWDVVWVRTTSQGREEVFVGRHDELAFLRGKLSSALDGRGGLALIGGEPGVGKTTLVRQLIRDAEARGALALFGRCYEFEGALPYSPFVEMLEHALALMPAELVREDMGEDAAEVARMVPELRRRFPDIPDPLDLPPEQQRRYFFNAVAAFIERAAARFPLLLVLDDVHWADVPTLLLIEHVAEVLPGMRVLGVGTYRDVELDVSRPLVASLDRMVRSRTVERVGLKRFDLAGVARMVEALAGREPPPEVVRVVFEETEGNPFFVMEVFRHLAEEGRLFDPSGAFRADLQVDELDVPESVRLVVGRRLERLGPESQRALAAGAVVGRGFPFALLEEITDVDSRMLLDIVEEAEAARVVVPEDRGGAIHYTFAHELIRQTLLTGLSLLRRQRLHLAVADAMERLYPDARESRPSEIAHHLLQAGAAADPLRTLDYLEHAVDRAMASAAFEEALRSAGDALSLVPREDVLRRARLMERQGQAARALGRYDECLAIWDDVVTAYSDLGEGEDAAALCWHMGYLQVWMSRFAEAYLLYERGLAALDGRRGAAMAGLMGSRALLLGFAGSTGMHEVSRAALAEAEAVASEALDDQQVGLVNWGRCIVDWSFAHVHDAEAAGRAAVEHLRRAGDLWGLVDALGWLSFPLGSGGQFAEGEAVAQEALELSLRLGHVGGEIIARRGVLINRTPATGDLEGLEQGLRKDLELCTAIRSPWASQSHAWLGFVHTMRGRLEEGLSHAEASAAIEPESAWAGLAWASRLSNRMRGGDTEQMKAMLDEARDDLRAVDRSAPNGILTKLSVAGEAAALLGLADLCAELYPPLAELADRLLLRPFDWALTQRVAGMVAACAGLPEQAESHFRTALEQAVALPNLLEEPQVKHRYASVLRARGGDGDAEQAHALLREALTGYQRLGMPLGVREVETLLR